jgi:hypothetical protein
MTTWYVDGDTLLYRIGFSCQKSIPLAVDSHGQIVEAFETTSERNEWLENNPEYEKSSLIEPVDRHIVTGRVRETLEKFVEFGASRGGVERIGQQWVIVISGNWNFRKWVAIERGYKANREKLPKPTHFSNVKDDVNKQAGFEFDMAVVTALGEADDHIAMAVKEGDVIVSNDKDFRQIPEVWFWDWTKGEEGWAKPINKLEATRNLYKQILTGDTVDNIPGIYGIGPKKAEGLLQDCTNEKEMYEKVLMAYIESVGVMYDWDEADSNAAYYKLMENARLVYLLRHPNDVWVPPNE